MRIKPEPISSNNEAVEPPPGFTAKPTGPSTNKERTPVPQNQLPSLPSPVDGEHVDKAETSTGRGKSFFRGHWLKVEDECLANSFMIVSAQPETKVPSFWVRASKIYNEAKSPGVSARSADVMSSKWKNIKKKIYFFNVIYSIISSEHESTHSVQEMVNLARKKYTNVYRSAFNLVHVWRIVKDHPAFVPQAMDVAACSKKAMTPGVTNSTSNKEANAGLVSNEGGARIVGQKRNEEGVMKSNTEQLPMLKKARAGNSSANQDTNAADAHISELLLFPTSMGASSSSSKQDTNAGMNPNEGDAQIIGLEGNECELLLFPMSMGTSNSSSEQDTNAGMNPNEADAQIIGLEGNETELLLFPTSMRASNSSSEQDTNASKNENYINFVKAKLELKKAKIEAMKAVAEAKNREVWLKEYEILLKDTSQMTEQQRSFHDKACEMINRRWNSQN